MCQLTRTAPFSSKVYSLTWNRRIIEVFASLLEAGVQPPVRPFGKLIRVLMKGNYNINSLRKSEQPLYEILLKNCHATKIKRNLMVGKFSSNLFFEQRGSKQIMITYPSFGKKENLPDLVELSNRINEGLCAITPRKYIIFSMGPPPHKRFRCIRKIIFPESLFGEQGTASESLRGILNGADKAITPWSATPDFYTP
ncbi:hypothetical protein GTU79_10850 [Sodalis ligni]|uniref:hypothetical protein n=1 Tax=Sodalis ligni TaxID=2697027 RepID=UPI001BDDF5C3|nr:hypothetical protein [Sodalis ligni]QWA13110.1 hypothetical protein GTU79_10850 [Sodalis ligni]